jgi:hypothetical protein
MTKSPAWPEDERVGWKERVDDALLAERGWDEQEMAGSGVASPCEGVWEGKRVEAGR